jgi:phospho-N-acetylmuramoyl-pentapeptide-transferase
MIAVGILLLYFVGLYFSEIRHLAALSGQLLPWPAHAPWWLFYSVGLFVWLGALNGANFTDGLDGLLSATTLVVLAGAFYALLDGLEALSLPAAVGFGALAVFLFFNWKPALLYLGDSGSLAVGALVAGLFIAKGWWLFLGLAVIVWVLEVGSVIVQVAVFRITRGSRVFLMSPLHHHFELAGWGERTTVLVFTGLQVLGGLSALVWLRYGERWGMAGLALVLGLTAVLLLKYHRRVR